MQNSKLHGVWDSCGINTLGSPIEQRDLRVIGLNNGGMWTYRHAFTFSKTGEELLYKDRVVTRHFCLSSTSVSERTKNQIER